MFKFFAAIVATALTVSSVASASSHIRSVDGDQMLRERSLEEQATTTTTTTKTWVSKLTLIANTDKYHMKPVRAIHARVQADAPAWDPTNKIFTSKYGATFEEKFHNALDSVNTASVEGALMGVQTDGINYNSRSEANKCVRAGNIKYVVFYDVVFAQTNETLALYETEYGPYLSLVSGKCDSATKLCQSINGDKGQPQLGPFVGKELKDADPRAPYPNAYRFSFPNTAVTKPYANKTEALRNATRRGLCAFDKLPDGVTCTYNYRIAGFVPLDDVVGITKMRNKDNTSTYKSFGEFCKDGRVEFKATGENGTWVDGLDFWRKPQNKSENAKRAFKLVNAYTAQLLVQKSTQIESTLIANTMTLLPTVAQLTAGNPPCYLNIKECSGPYGCKRSLYSQQCRVCTAADTGCTVNVSNFVYPTLAKAVGSTSASTTEQANDGSGDDILLVVAIICGVVVLAIASLVAYRQRRRIREPKLKAMLLSTSTRASGGSAPCNLVEMATQLEKPSVALPLTPTAESEIELKALLHPQGYNALKQINRNTQINSMGPKKGKKEKKGGGKGSKKAAGGAADENDPSKENEAERMELVKHAKTLLEMTKKEEQAFNEFQQQREKINYFWIVEKKNFEDRKAELRNKERERQDLEEKHQVEIKVYKQRVKHLLYEHQNDITELKKEMEKSLKLSQDDYRDNERELKFDKRRLKFDLKEIELSHEDYLKSLKQEQDRRITILRQEFERHAKELQQKYERKRKAFRDELEAKRKLDTQKIEEKKNLHIAHLMTAHEKAFGEIKNYYNDITHNNLDLIKSLKEEVSEMKKKEAQDEKLMFEISQENKRMSEPLKRALQDVEKLRKNIKVYQEEKIDLRNAKAQLLVLEEEYATLSWEFEVLQQRFAQVQREYNELNDQFQSSIYDVQQKTGLKNLLLEKKMDAMTMRLEQKDAELNEILLHAKLEPAIVDRVKGRLEDIMANKNHDLRELEKEMNTVARLQKELATAMELKMSEYGLPLDELGFTTQTRGLPGAAAAMVETSSAVKGTIITSAGGRSLKKAPHNPAAAAPVSGIPALSPSNTVGGGGNQSSHRIE